MSKSIFITLFTLFLVITTVLSAYADPFDDQRGRYLIIVHDIFYSHILPLAQWKHQKGMEVEIARISEIGSTNSQIKNFIQTAYDTWEVPPEYLLLVGDTEYIPIGNTGWTQGDSDYGDVTGDFREDIYIGRFSVDTALECQTIVAKSLNYERTPYMEDDSWFTRACLICNDNDYSPDEYIYDTEYITALMEDDGYDDVHDLRASTNDNSQTVINLVNQGVTFLNYRGQGGGHWASPFSVEGGQTSPGWKQPIVISGTCSTGGINWDGTHGEGWIRAGTPQNPGGGVAYYGTTTSGSGAITNLRSEVDRAFFDAIFLYNKNQLGQAALYAKDAMISAFPSETSEYEGWILQGDPELNMWTGVPQDLTVECPPIIPAGVTEFIVNVSVDDDPVENALVCFYKEDEVYSWTRTNQFGEATLSFDAISPLPGESISLTITGENLMPYQDEIEIVTGEAIEGYVVNSITGLSVTGAKIYLDSAPIYAYAQDNTAFYRLYLPEAGTFNIYADYWGYQPFISAPIVVVEDDTTNYNIFMNPLEDAGSIQGTIIDYNGEPVSGAKITLVNVPTRPIYSNEDGSYQLSPLVSNYDYEVKVDHPNYELQSQSLHLNPNANETVDFIMAYVEIFEATDGGFVPEDNFLNEWQWGTPNDFGGPELSYSGNNCWGTDLDNLYDPNRNMYLYSSLYTLNHSLTPSLVFYTWYETQDGWDGGNVRISADGGETWEIIIPNGEDGYPDPSVVALGGQPGYTGFSDGWIRQEFDLSEYVDQAVQFSLRFASSNATMRGWFIDDFAVNGGTLSLACATNFQAVSEEDNVTLTWDDPETDYEFTGFNLYRRTENNEDFGDPIAFMPSGTNTYNDNNLASGTYFYGLTTVYTNGLQSLKTIIEVQVIGSGVNDNDLSAIPSKYSLEQNYPNPFNPTTTIHFELPKASEVDLEIYDISGKLVKTLLSDTKEAGYHSVTWSGTDENGTNVPSGVYFYRMKSNTFSNIKRCLLVK